MMDPRIETLTRSLLGYLDLKAGDRPFIEKEQPGYWSMCHAERFCANCHSQNRVTNGAGTITSSTSVP